MAGPTWVPLAWIRDLRRIGAHKVGEVAQIAGHQRRQQGDANDTVPAAVDSSAANHKGAGESQLGQIHVVIASGRWCRMPAPRSASTCLIRIYDVG